jgi:hypothetical protein
MTAAYDYYSDTAHLDSPVTMITAMRDLAEAQAMSVAHAEEDRR